MCAGMPKAVRWVQETHGFEELSESEILTNGIAIRRGPQTGNTVKDSAAKRARPRPAPKYRAACSGAGSCMDGCADVPNKNALSAGRASFGTLSPGAGGRECCDGNAIAVDKSSELDAKATSRNPTTSPPKGLGLGRHLRLGSFGTSGWSGA